MFQLPDYGFTRNYTQRMTCVFRSVTTEDGMAIRKPIQYDGYEMMGVTMCECISQRNVNQNYGLCASFLENRCPF